MTMLLGHNILKRDYITSCIMMLWDQIQRYMWDNKMIFLGPKTNVRDICGIMNDDVIGTNSSFDTIL